MITEIITVLHQVQIMKGCAKHHISALTRKVGGLVVVMGGLSDKQENISR